MWAISGPKFLTLISSGLCFVQIGIGFGWLCVTVLHRLRRCDLAGKRKMQGAGRVCLRKRGKFYTARLTYQGERRQLPLKVGNLTTAEDKAREMEKMCERGVDWDLV
jgi:hypothetical protein